MKLNFTKMHGCGNDYIYFDCFEHMPEDPGALSVRLSDRHFSVGGDGIVLICPSGCADAKMRMFNIDGSEGKMCGNAIRCVGKYLHDIRGVDKTTLTIETLSGIKTLELTVKDGKTESVSVNMGAPILEGEKIPTTFKGETVVAQPLEVCGKVYSVTCVSMGNPHCIVFTDNVRELPLEKIGPEFENNGAFPQRVNTEFVRVIDKNTLEMRVWERGSGETYACGTGACASVAAACKNGFCDKGSEVCVKLIGGELNITYYDDRVIMRGGAEVAFTGAVEV